MTLLIRLLPVGSNVLTNLAAGISRVRLLPFRRVLCRLSRKLSSLRWSAAVSMSHRP